VAGQIIARGERTFLVRIYMGRDSEGKRKYYNHTVHGNKKDAQAYLNQVLRDRDLGLFTEPSRKTLNEYLDQWLETAVKSRVRERTYEDYVTLLARYVRGPLEGRRLSQITPMEVQALYTQMTERGLSARTVRYTHGVLRDAFQQAVKWQLLPRNPAQFVDLPRQEHHEMRAFSPEQATRFLEASQGDPLYPLFLLALTTGMRPGEYLALQWKDLNFETGALSVCRTLARNGQFEDPKTARSRRSVTLLPTVTQALRSHRAQQAAWRLSQGPTYKNMDLVFASETGGPLNEHNLVRRHFKPILKAAGLPNARLYDLRHTCATLLLAAGENVKVISERLGHASVALTLDTYSHVLPGMQQAAADKLQALLFPGQTAHKR
jgi:integrase